MRSSEMSSCVPGRWRKRMGVEPTKDRLAAPPRFEVRTPHRGRFSSLIRCGWRGRVRGGAEQVEPVVVQAAQIAAAQCVSLSGGEFPGLDRHLAAIIELVAELSGGEHAMVRRQP